MFKNLTSTSILAALLLSIALFATSAQARVYDDSTPNGSSRDRFPKGPRQEMTVGALCEHPDEFRYPEKIKYCKRDVASDLKREIIKDYDQRFGYEIGRMDRTDFKIDHYIPLCMGGANTVENLWPQHKSVYEQTDTLEMESCQKMQAGRLKQADAVILIKRAKNDLSQVPEILRQIRAL